MLIWTLLTGRTGDDIYTSGAAASVVETMRGGCTEIELIVQNGQLIDEAGQQFDPATASTPDVILFRTNSLIRFANALRDLHGGKPKLFYMGMPYRALDQVDVFFYGIHNAVPDSVPNGILHRLPPYVVENALDPRYEERWSQQLAALPKPWVTVVVGATVKNQSRVEVPDIGALLVQARKLAGTGTVFALNSPRTQRPETEALSNLANADAGTVFYPWRKGMPPEENPYRHLLRASDHLLVTGDSLNMCWEAALTGKRPFIYHQPDTQWRKLRQKLYWRLFYGGASHDAWQQRRFRFLDPLRLKLHADGSSGTRIARRLDWLHRELYDADLARPFGDDDTQRYGEPLETLALMAPFKADMGRALSEFGIGQRVRDKCR